MKNIFIKIIIKKWVFFREGLPSDFTPVCQGDGKNHKVFGQVSKKGVRGPNS